MDNSFLVGYLVGGAVGAGLVALWWAEQWSRHKPYCDLWKALNERRGKR